MIEGLCFYGIFPHFSMFHFIGIPMYVRTSFSKYIAPAMMVISDHHCWPLLIIRKNNLFSLCEQLIIQRATFYHSLNSNFYVYFPLNIIFWYLYKCHISEPCWKHFFDNIIILFAYEFNDSAFLADRNSIILY